MESLKVDVNLNLYLKAASYLTLVIIEKSECHFFHFGRLNLILEVLVGYYYSTSSFAPFGRSRSVIHITMRQIVRNPTNP